MSDKKTLRDTFAAAALTGLMRKLRPGSVFDLTITARQAFELADAMLRERARNGAPDARETVTDHDAAPAAKAAELARSPGQSPRGTGDTTREPAAWLLDSSRQDAPIGLFWTQDDAAVLAGGNTGHVFPLYRDPPPPTLTDAERTLIEKLTWPHPDPRMGRSLFVTPDERDIAVALLARHGGDA